MAFEINGDRRELVVDQQDDWIDPQLVSGLNELLPEEGGKFYCFDGGGQCFAITWTTPEQADALEALRSVRLFDRAPDAWLGSR